MPITPWIAAIVPLVPVMAEAPPPVPPEARICLACHLEHAADEPQSAPPLAGVAGRPAARDPVFRYSPAMQTAAADGLVWDAASLDAYLARPTSALPGTSMAFGGVDDAEERARLIAWLERLR